MPIEKLSNNFNHGCAAITKKLNELIDAYNTRELDRSEQMARVIDDLMEHTSRIGELEYKLESLTEESSDGDEIPINCPWCNSVPVLTYPNDKSCTRWFHVQCCFSSCYNKSNFIGQTKQEAVSAWNKRT